LALCSPLLVETVVWFLERWSKTYLFPSTRDSETFSHNLLGAYGQNSPRGKAVIGFLVEKLDLVFMGWRAQEDVLKELARLLETLSMHQHIRGEILRSTQWMGLMQNVVNNLHILPSEVQSSLIEHLCRMASGAEQTSVQTHFITLLTNVAETRLRSLLGPDFTKMAQRGESIAQLIVCFEMFRGVAMASDGSNFEIIFSFSASYFDSFVKLMDYYHNFPEVVLVIFKFYNSFIECQLPYLNTKQMDVVFRSILSLFQVYASKNAGKKRAGRHGEEDDLQEDIVFMLKIMTNLISKDFLDFSDDAGWYSLASFTEEKQNKTKSSFFVSGYSAEVFIRPEPGFTQVSDVVFYGLNIVIPLINAGLLQFPELCLQYFKLIVFMIEIYSEKLVGLPQPLFQSLMKSLEFGIEGANNAEVAKLTMEALSGLGSYCDTAKTKGDNSPVVQLLSSTLDTFLVLVMRLILFKDFDSNLMEPASESLFAMICARFVSTLSSNTFLAKDAPPN